MTNKEAIIILADMGDKCTAKEAVALVMAFKALTQKPCEDAISRQAVLEFIENQIDHSLWAFEKLVKGIKALPSVPPKPMTDIPDKIRAEIKNIAFDSQEIDGEHESFMIVNANDALKIIDKYRT